MNTTQLRIAAMCVALTLCAGVAWSAPAAPKEFATKQGVKMMLLPGGTFTMGDDDGEVDEPEHEVAVSPFYIDVCEVNQEEYERVMGDNPSKVKGKKNPVEQIRWSDAVRYCNKRSTMEGLEPAYDLKTWTCRYEANGYRLPTEAEWEYAARAGTDTAYCFGDSPKQLPAYGWFKDNARGKPRPVGQRKPNAWGLQDMHANVWEWCNDFYKVDYYQEGDAKDPKGPEKGEKEGIAGRLLEFDGGCVPFGVPVQRGPRVHGRVFRI